MSGIACLSAIEEMLSHPPMRVNGWAPDFGLDSSRGGAARVGPAVLDAGQHERDAARTSLSKIEAAVARPGEIIS